MKYRFAFEECKRLRAESEFCGSMLIIKILLPDVAPTSEQVFLYLHPEHGYLLYYPPIVGERLHAKRGMYAFWSTLYPKIISGHNDTFKLKSHTIKESHYTKIMARLIAEAI